jgi:nucleotide-binding universal stress UspA family protein
VKKPKIDQHVVIAIDCFKSDPAKLSNGLSSAFSFCQQMREIPLVRCVVGPSQFGLSAGIAKVFEEQIRKIGTTRLNDVLSEMKGNPPRNTEIVFLTEASIKAEARTLLKSAKKAGAGLITVFSHAGAETTRPPLGGFVLSLIYQTHIPVLVINAKTAAKRPVKRIAFATDFTKGSEIAFNTVIRIARELQSEIVLLHILPTLPYSELAASSGVAGGWTAVEVFLKKEETAIKKKAAKWLEHAKRERVSTSFELVTGTLAIADSISKIAEQSKCDIIAMTEKTGPIASLILGSVTRSVLRDADKPVLVLTLPKKS